MNPSFNTPHIRNLVPVFWAKSNQLRDIWLEKLRDKPDGETIDILLGTTCATLDIIGIAGFGYEFHSLEGTDEDELAKAFMSVFNSNDKKPSTIGLLVMIICHRLGIPTKVSRRLKANLATIRRIGMRIVEDKKTILKQNKGGEESHGRDLLTLLIKSNIAPDVEKDEVMTDEEIFGPRLRQELLETGPGDEISMEELDKIPYLDKFVREVLRVYAVAPMTSREASCDTVVPVGEGYTDAHGIVRHEIRLQKGDAISIPILAMNRAKDVWGEDALDFKPERWNNLPDTVNDMPGVWSHLMTVKALLYSLVRAFEFGIDPSLEIVAKTMLVSRPHLPGPPSNNWFLGHFLMLIELQNTTLWETWKEKYGKVMQFKGFCGEYHVCIWDMRAINYVLSHNTTFSKSESARRGLAMILGEGLLAADELTHKRQRRIMNPAFSALHVRNLLPIFAEKSNQLCDIWMDMLHDKPEGETIEVLSWLTRATLDIIGLAGKLTWTYPVLQLILPKGFGYDFRSLEDKDKNELAKAYAELFNSNAEFSTLIVVKGLLCNMLGIPTKDSRRFDANQSTVRRIGMDLMKDKKALLQKDSHNEESLAKRCPTRK
ncbi:Secologanin synthase Short=SLS [Rhizoctonia solani AG-1 IB]|uniref:Secologanin synthase Short=SLS n=1 Tax=Thanatephorus cucumeris (strain AG1-IB / isolate 7/3/14) TaxID=1108050 RepID=M5C0Y2_THACB|nr:Secologanin synthase Short=SLS [Rhizoctonia solani AG-1 IB]